MASHFRKHLLAALDHRREDELVFGKGLLGHQRTRKVQLPTRPRRIATERANAREDAHDLVVGQSARCLAAYLYAAAGPGESTTDLVYSGSSMVAENGQLLAETARFRFDSQLALLANVGSNALFTGGEAARYGNAHASIVPYQAFHARDGEFVLAVASEKLWIQTCEALHRRDWLRDARFLNNAARVEHRDAL